ncbi:unnamed protein product, partial [Meganyctiphanes norvegica]
MDLSVVVLTLAILQGFGSALPQLYSEPLASNVGINKQGIKRDCKQENYKNGWCEYNFFQIQLVPRGTNCRGLWSSECRLTKAKRNIVLPLGRMSSFAALEARLKSHDVDIMEWFPHSTETAQHCTHPTWLWKKSIRPMKNIIHQRPIEEGNSHEC